VIGTAMITQNDNQLARLKTPSDYLSDGRSHIFPSRFSFDWFVRKHKVRLLERGAISAPTGRKLINVNVFDQLVLEIGSETVLERQK